jgi:hypothetical protein
MGDLITFISTVSSVALSDADQDPAFVGDSATGTDQHARLDPFPTPALAIRNRSTNRSMAAG